MSIIKALGRVWIPLVVVFVVAAAAFTISRIHEIFGAEDTFAYPERHAGKSEAFAAKQVVYEVFGPAGTVADINYIDIRTEPHQVEGARLPWSHVMAINSPAVVANVVAQGDSGSIGCRIVIDGVVKVERISNEVNAYTYCLVQGA